MRVVLFFWVSASAVGWAANPVAGVESRDRQVRKDTVRRLNTLRRDIFEELRKVYRSDNKHDYDGPGHTAIRQMGTWRFEEAAPLLAKHIDWRLNDDSMPKDRRFSPMAMYPAAAALAKIGGAAVDAQVFSIAHETDDDDVLRLCAWVFVQMYGSGFAEDRMRKIANLTSYEPVRRRLLKVADFSANGEVPRK